MIQSSLRWVTVRFIGCDPKLPIGIYDRRNMLVILRDQRDRERTRGVAWFGVNRDRTPRVVLWAISGCEEVVRLQTKILLK